VVDGVRFRKPVVKFFSRPIGCVFNKVFGVPLSFFCVCFEFLVATYAKDIHSLLTDGRECLSNSLVLLSEKFLFNVVGVVEL